MGVIKFKGVFIYFEYTLSNFKIYYDIHYINKYYNDKKELYEKRKLL